MNDAEYNYYHAYQDMKEEFEEKIYQRTIELLEEYWKDENRIRESFNEYIMNDDDYMRLIKIHHELGDAKKVGDITFSMIEHYLFQQAEEEAENQLT